MINLDDFLKSFNTIKMVKDMIYKEIERYCNENGEHDINKFKCDNNDLIDNNIKNAIIVYFEDNDYQLEYPLELDNEYTKEVIYPVLFANIFEKLDE